MKVPDDYVCEHGLPRPWVTCTECMFKSAGERPQPPALPPPARAARRGAMPKAAGDPLPVLLGDKDVSVPVWDFDVHMDGPGRGWLFAENGFPWELRPGGWVYLRHEGRLGGRARVKGIGFRDVRQYHTGDSSDAGPGPTIEVDPDTWEPTSIDLGELSESQRQGYRYLITAIDGTVTHLSASDRIPAQFKTDPPAPARNTPDQRV